MATEYAFPEQEKEPITDAKHVRNAIARFSQVEDVTDADRDRAWRRPPGRSGRAPRAASHWIRWPASQVVRQGSTTSQLPSGVSTRTATSRVFESHGS